MALFSKSIKAIAAGALLLGAVEANAAASTAKPMRVGPVQVHGVLGTDGGKIVGKKSGKEAMLRGMSMFWSDATGIQYYNKEVIKWAVNNLKIDVFRYAMGIEYYDSDGGTSNKLDDGYSFMKAEDTQKSKIDQMVEAAIENDVYIIIDWHSHRAYSSNEKTKAKSFFSEMAAKYKGVPNIIWEVFNEPAGSFNDWSQIKSYANDVISGIRTNSDNLALVGTPNWSQMGSCGGVSGGNVGYVFHFYAGTHSVGQYGGAVTSCKNSGNAVFITEWGTTTADGKGDANTSASSSWTDFMEQNKISNCNWSLRQKVTTVGNQSEEGSAMFAGDKPLITQAALSAASYTNSGNFVKSYLNKYATDWSSQFASSLKSGSCSFTATAKESAGSVSGSFKSGCTYTSSNEGVVTNAGGIAGPGIAILTGNDGSQSLVTITEEPKQTLTGFVDFSCYVSGSCSNSKTMKDLDGDGKNEVQISATGMTEEGATVTVKSLNESIVKIKKATCSNSKACFGKSLNAQVLMFEFTGTIGEAKVVATAPAVTGYIAMNDTITIQFTKTGDKIAGDFKNMKVAKGSTTAVTFPTETTYGKAPITYTFDGQATSPYLEYIAGAPGYLIAGNEDAIVKITAHAPESAERAETEVTITVIVGDSATAASKGNVPIPFIKSAGKFSAQFVNNGLLLSAPQSGNTSIQVITTLGQVAKSMQLELGAGQNWIPMSGLSAGKYIVRIKQGSNIQSLFLKIK